MTRVEIITKLDDWLEQIRAVHRFVEKAEELFGGDSPYLEGVLIMSDYYTDTLEELITGKAGDILGSHLYELGMLKEDKNMFELANLLIKQKEEHERNISRT